MTPRNTAASVRARLLNRARESQQEFNLVLTRYALERLLYRLSISPHASQFLLKGALLFDLWFDIPIAQPAMLISWVLVRPSCPASKPSSRRSAPLRRMTG